MMITSSLNSNVAQRTEFFGLMRCIGATPVQIMRMVRKEALGWCRLAIPMGTGVSILLVWILCAVLRILSPVYFREMPAFGISLPGIGAGAAAGRYRIGYGVRQRDFVDWRDAAGRRSGDRSRY